jgi:acyl-coenzyme A thioesterase PaaI-like protein
VSFEATEPTGDYDHTLKELQGAHHSNCLFQLNPPVDNLRFCFSEEGMLTGRFVFSAKHQGYNGVVHGGIIAAVIDASMAQCCMGHGIIAYTTDLSIRYRNPVRIAMPILLETRIVGKARDVLFSLECNIVQEGQVYVSAKGRFFRVAEEASAEW